MKLMRGWIPESDLIKGVDMEKKRTRKDTLLRVRMVHAVIPPKDLKYNPDIPAYQTWINKQHGKGFMLLSIHPGNNLHIFGRVEVTDL